MFDIMYLEPVCPLFWWLNPGLFQSKQGSFGFQVDMYGVFGSILHFIRKTVVPLGWCPSCSTLQGAPLTGDMGPNKYPRDIFGVYRVDDFSGPPSQGYHHFPYEHWDLYFFDMFFFEPPPPRSHRQCVPAGWSAMWGNSAEIVNGRQKLLQG